MEHPSKRKLEMDRLCCMPVQKGSMCSSPLWRDPMCRYCRVRDLPMKYPNHPMSSALVDVPEFVVVDPRVKTEGMKLFPEFNPS